MFTQFHCGGRDGYNVAIIVLAIDIHCNQPFKCPTSPMCLLLILSLHYKHRFRPSHTCCISVRTLTSQLVLHCLGQRCLASRRPFRCYIDLLLRYLASLPSCLGVPGPVHAGPTCRHPVCCCLHMYVMELSGLLPLYLRLSSLLWHNLDLI